MLTHHTTHEKIKNNIFFKSKSKNIRTINWQNLEINENDIVKIVIREWKKEDAREQEIYWLNDRVSRDNHEKTPLISLTETRKREIQRKREATVKREMNFWV